MTTRLALLLALAAGALGLSRPARAGGSGILNSKHNLSVTGPGEVRAVTEKRTCVFCHVAHGSQPRAGNRPDSAAVVQRYASSTMTAPTGVALTGASRTCLSCHDGTIALGQTAKGKGIAMAGAGPGGRMREGRANLGTNLSGSHPVSFRPLATRSLRAPQRDDAVKLDQHGMVQCTSCHDPHAEDVDPVQKKFLVKSNQGSAICQSCHALPLWQSSSHQTSTAALLPGSGLASNRAAIANVSEMGCGGCHQTHGAGRTRLVRGELATGDDQVCLQCHDGQVARLDVAREMAKAVSHAAPPGGPSGHDAAEGPHSATNRLPESRPSARRHVTCVDCHEPHAAFRMPASAPQASGALAGVWGIDRNGGKVEQVRYEYEVCFKCHADSANQPQARGQRATGVRRAIVDVNLRRVFDQSAASSHPVTNPGRNANVPSLLPPYGPASMLYCSDCHASDGAGQAGVPRGPHGSIYASLLERNYSTADRTPESPSAYALCYKCHDRGVLLSDRSAFPLHARHVVGSSTSCATCHASHGVSALAGNPQNNAHLMDFDVNVVRPSSKGLRQYAARGGSGGTCTLSCHGREHDGASY
jgi:predicted CXXCH cytochrome family protein